MKLFDCFSASGYHTSLVTTFGVSFPAYELIALSKLRAAGCVNNVLVADSCMLVQALNDPAGHPTVAGRQYSVVGAQASGVFHPKLVLQLGKASGRLIVASANMTAAGMAGNFEVAGIVSVTAEDPRCAPVLRAALDYLLQFFEVGSLARRQVQWALNRASWLPRSAPSDAVIELGNGERVALLCSDASASIGNRFAGLVGSRAVKRLTVVSPYWDDHLYTLKTLASRLGAKALAVAIQPRSGLFPKEALESSGALAYDIGGVPRAREGRFAHAKVFIAESDQGDCILFGSPNCTDAALGSGPKRNEEAALFRELPAGTTLEMLGLEEALEDGNQLDLEKIAAYEKSDDLPLAELHEQVPGRFELTSDVLRWWPSTSFVPSDSRLELLDRDGIPLVGDLRRIGTAIQPCVYRFSGATPPHFARVHASGVQSALAVVLVEQAIQQAQRRLYGRKTADALAFLDDDESDETLWLLRIDDDLAEAAAELRVSRRAEVEEADVPPPDSEVLPYEAFVAGRNILENSDVAGRSLLAGGPHEAMRAFLNSRISKLASYLVVEEPEAPKPDLSTGDEPGGSNTAPANNNDPDGEGPDAEPHPSLDAKEGQSEQVRRYQRYILSSGRDIREAIESFAAGLREKASTQPLTARDLLRLRLLLMVVLRAGSNKANLLSKDSAQPLLRHQVLSFGADGWHGLVYRLLYEFFRDQSSMRKALIGYVHLEGMTEEFGFPEDVLECWATCFYALCAARTAVDERAQSNRPILGEDLLAQCVYRLTRLNAGQAANETVASVFEGMSRRYGERLGADASAVWNEHRAWLARAALPAASAAS